MSTQAFNNAISTENPNTGTSLGHIEVIQSGIDRNNINGASTESLKRILGIEGDAVGTLNTQDIYNKTLNL